MLSALLNKTFPEHYWPGALGLSKVPGEYTGWKKAEVQGLSRPSWGGGDGSRGGRVNLPGQN